MNSLLKATAVAMVNPDFLMSPVFLWVTANAIIIWLFSSSRRGRSRTDDNSSSTSSSAAGNDGEVVPGAVDSLYTSSSEYEAFSDAGSGRRADAPMSKKLAREAKAERGSDRPRVRKKPAAGQGAPSPRAFAAEAREPEPDYEIRSEGTPEAAVADDDEDDVSMDSLWQSIVRRRAARPVVVQKSESWSNDELPRLQRVAETAAATRREMRKSVSAVSKAAAAPQPPPSVPSAVRQLGWRTRDVLVAISADELLRRTESFIRRQYEHRRLQRQESEQRQQQQQLRFHLLRAPGPGAIRV